MTRTEASAGIVPSHTFRACGLGGSGRCDPLHKAVSNCLTSAVSRLRVAASKRLFDRRCEALEWAPHGMSGAFYVGSHGGDVMLCRFMDGEIYHTDLIGGKGKGGSITDMKLHPASDSVLLTASHDQRVCKHDLPAQRRDVLFDTMDCDHWFTGIDAAPAHDAIVAVDSKGLLYLFDSEGMLQNRVRVQRGKLQHCEVSRHNPWLMVTCSNDREVCLFDIRKLSSRSASSTIGPLGASNVPSANSMVPCLSSYKMDSIPTAAYFCPHGGHKILVTTQGGGAASSPQVAVLDLARDFSEAASPLLIDHPHRFYQHMSPIKATWHPIVEDMFVIGRYDDSRGIDVMDAVTGERIEHLLDAKAPGICPINKFSPDGSFMASCTGHCVMVWEHRSSFDDGDAGQASTSIASSAPRQRPAKEAKRKSRPSGSDGKKAAQKRSKAQGPPEGKKGKKGFEK